MKNAPSRLKWYNGIMEIQARPQEAIRDAAVRQGRRLEYFTVGWNLIEAAVALGAGLFAGSIALIGFGIDSLIETSSGAVLLWRLQEGEKGEKRERMALKLVGLSLLALAAYVAIDAVKGLIQKEPPEESLVGIILAAVSLVVMPLLAWAKRKVATKLNSQALVADSHQTDICAYLSAILLVGLSLNALFGWWWADPVAALAMVPIIVKEGLEALRGEACEECPPSLATPPPHGLADCARSEKENLYRHDSRSDSPGMIE